jgi:hypothetical protein
MTFDSTPSIPADIAPARTMRLGDQWLTTEIAILRALYGTAGANGVREKLPHRSLASIRAKAAAEGIRGIRQSTLGKRFARIYTQRDDIDMAVREGYIHAKEKGAIKALAARIGRPAWWVQKRAAQLGVTRTNTTRVDAWTPAELDIVEQYSAAGLDVIAKKLRIAGFKRTPTAIAVIMKRRQIDRTDPDRWSATQLAPLFGVNPSTVTDWIERRGLPAKKSGDGIRAALLCHRRDLRKWMAANPRFVDLRRVDQAWFWDVMFGAAS